MRREHRSPTVLAVALVLSLAPGLRAQAQETETTPPPPAPEDARVQEQQKTLEELKRAQQELSRRLKQSEEQQAQRVKQLEAENAGLKQRLDGAESQAAQEQEQAEQTRKRLQLYGWVDFGVLKAIGIDENHNYNGWFSGDWLFSVGNVNLILDANPFDKWRALVEVRFTYAPDGKVTNYEIPGLTSFERTNTTMEEGGASGMGEYKWGAICLERALLEWAPRDELKILAGQFITPYGIWNLDHGAPALISLLPPLPVAAELFPNRQFGFQIHGTTFLGSESLEYALTLSNGRSPISNMDLDNNKAVGGRVALASSRFGEAKLGFSFYVGRFTDKKSGIDTRQPVQAPILPRHTESITTQFDEVGFNVDLQLDFQWLGFRSEVGYSRVKYVDPYRASMPVSKIYSMAMGQGTTPLADHQLLAAYGLVFVPLPWFDLRPYFGAGYFDCNDNIEWDNGYYVTGGLNYRPNPRVVVKLEYTGFGFPNDPAYAPALKHLADLNRTVSFFGVQTAITY